MTTARLVGGRYELGELIGYGGMAEVHRGRDVRLGRDVAIKILRADLARDPSFLNRFRREAQSAAGLNHPSIVAVYDSGEDLIGVDGEQTVLPYIVMEFVQGRTLRDILKSEGPLPARRAMEVTAEVCGALDYSHRNGIIHRDVKPANIMITTTGAVKVMDFGIARAVADSAATVTQTAAVIGTAQYLSPEQARGETVDARSDVYAVGCVLYELVTGKPPFTGDSPVAVAYQHVRENAVLPSAVNPSVPRAVDSIAMKALAKNTQNRYQSTAEMRSDLQRAIADQPVLAESVMNDEERTQFISRPDNPNRPPVIPLSDEDEGGSGRSALVWVAVVVALLLVIGAASFAIVQLTKNDKPKTAAMPGLIGQNVAAATVKLQSLGLQRGTVTVSNGPCGEDPSAPVSVSEGQICTQQYGTGDAVQLNSAVNLTTYTPAAVSIPNVANMTVQQATTTLQAAKLTGKITQTSVDQFTPANNYVVKTDPAIGTAVTPGQAITLYVSTGVEAIPNVTGKQYDVAKAQLNNQGFSNVQMGTAPETGTDKAKDGTVVDQDPLTGKWPSNQAITLTVYKYVAPAPVTTPACASGSSATTSAPSGSSTAGSVSCTTPPASSSSGTPTGSPTPSGSGTPTR